MALFLPCFLPKDGEKKKKGGAVVNSMDMETPSPPAAIGK